MPDAPAPDGEIFRSALWDYPRGGYLRRRLDFDLSVLIIFMTRAAPWRGRTRVPGSCPTTLANSSRHTNQHQPELWRATASRTVTTTTCGFRLSTSLEEHRRIGDSSCRHSRIRLPSFSIDSPGCTPTDFSAVDFADGQVSAHAEIQGVDRVRQLRDHIQEGDARRRQAEHDNYLQRPHHTGDRRRTKPRVILARW